MVSVPDVSQLFKEGRLLHYKKNEYVVRVEDKPQGVYFVESGLVNSLSHNKLGETYVHMIYRPGEIFPLAWTLDHTARQVYFQAYTDLAVRRISHEQFSQLAYSGGGATEALLKYTSYYLVTYSDRIQNLEYKYAAERLAYRLLFLASRHGHKSDKGLLLDLPLTYANLADSVNLSRKSIQRELEKLVRKGLIEWQDRHITLLDPRKLASELSDTLEFERWGL